jgi:hypothetical protein
MGWSPETREAALQATIESRYRPSQAPVPEQEQALISNDAVPERSAPPDGYWPIKRAMAFHQASWSSLVLSLSSALAVLIWRSVPPTTPI